MDVLLRKQLNSFTPADPNSVEAARKIKAGEFVHATLKTTDPRSAQQHRFFWGLMSLLYNNQRLKPGQEGYFVSPEDVKDRLLIAIGEFEVREVPGFGKVPKPHSIAYRAMPQKRFNEVVEKVVTFVNEHVDVVEENARQKVAEYLESEGL